MAESSAAVPEQLVRRLGAGDAVLIGLGSMVGAGVFAALGRPLGPLVRVCCWHC